MSCLLDFRTHDSWWLGGQYRFELVPRISTGITLATFSVELLPLTLVFPVSYEQSYT
jgi:hypothetical protein